MAEGPRDDRRPSADVIPGRRRMGPHVPVPLGGRYTGSHRHRHSARTFPDDAYWEGSLTCHVVYVLGDRHHKYGSGHRVSRGHVG